MYNSLALGCHVLKRHIREFKFVFNVAGEHNMYTYTHCHKAFV